MKGRDAKTLKRTHGWIHLEHLRRVDRSRDQQFLAVSDLTMKGWAGQVAGPSACGDSTMPR
jgi:hypothetical protein